MLLNRDNFIHLNYNSGRVICDYRSGNALFFTRDFEDHDYFFIEFLSSKCFNDYPLTNLIPSDILDKIRTDNNTFLLLSNTHEAFHSIVDGIYQHVLSQNIPFKKVILMNESKDLYKEVLEVAKKYNCDTLNVEWSLIFESTMKNQTYHLIDQIPNTLEVKDYPKKYLNFNRRWRAHRPLLVSLLIANNLLDYGSVSLGDSDDNNSWDKVFWWLEEYCKKDVELSKLLETNKQRILNTPPLYLDKLDLKTNWVENEVSTKPLYENTLFSVVNETNFFTDKNNAATRSVSVEGSRFLSEKTFKPIANRHPFIIVSVPGMLESLKELGYQTFHPYIDETYDTIQDDYQRMKAIVKEIDRLCHLTKEQELEFINNLTPIVKYNLRNLLKREKFTYKTL